MRLYHAEPVTIWKRRGAAWRVLDDCLLILTRSYGRDLGTACNVCCLG